MDRRILGVLFILSFLVWMGSGLWVFSHARGSNETPAYLPVEKDGKFQVRDYPALGLVRTALEADASGSAMSGSFRRLAAYLKKGNAAGRKIPMTAPVLVARAGAASESAPASPATMSFILPKAVAAQGAPAPGDPAVVLAEQPAGRYAVLRYSGGRDAVSEARAAERLDGWLRGRHWETEGTPSFAYYDPPWVPPIFRRNEVWVRVHGGTAP